jgi:ferric-dicitrate binding protein FerR (iron transport regulator)
VQVDNEGKVLDRLTPARQLQWDDRTRQSRTVTVDTTSLLAWQQGQLKFDNEKLETIAGTLSRWYNVKILFRDSALRNCRLMGAFENKIPLPQILNTLSNVIDMHWTMDEKKRIVILSGKGCH